MPSLKTCLALDQIMRITDPAWPAVQEAARMMLREDGRTIEAPASLHLSIQELILKMGNNMPARQTFPKVILCEQDSIVFMTQTEIHPRFFCGLKSPPIHTLWIPFEASNIWSDLERAMHDLLDAGYPGCLGCGGHDAEEEWDEDASRKRMQLDFGS